MPAKTNHTAHHKTAQSHTLMRRAVKKPAPSLKRKLKVSPALDSDLHRIVLGEGQISNFKKPKKNIAIKKSDKIRHFINVATHTAPAEPLFNIASSEPIVIEPTKKHASSSTKPAPVKSSLDLILERGLERATSHLEPAHKVKKRKHRSNTLAITSVVAVVVIAATLLGTNAI